MSKNHDVWINILKAMKRNGRPTVHGRILKEMDLDFYSHKTFFVDILDFKDYKFGCIAKDYLLKKDMSLRDNSYLVPVEVLPLVNYLCYQLFKVYGERNNVYYTGNLGNFDMYYENSYSFFQKELLSIYSSYDYYIKVDIKNFYKNIDLKMLKSKFPESKKLIRLFKCLGIEEFPIFQDCVGLSYVASTLYLAEVDFELEKYMTKYSKKLTYLRYSDDLYILFNANKKLGDLEHEITQEKIKDDIGEILKKFKLSLNEKFVIEDTSNLPDEISTKLYDFYVEDKDFDIHEIIGEEEDVINRIKNYIKSLSKIISVEAYNDLVSTCFSYKAPGTLKFEKNFFNEILYNKYLNLMLRKNEIIKIMKQTDILSSLKYDPRRITLLILFSRNEELIKNMLFSIYSKLENNKATPIEIVALLTYITQRNIKAETREKIIHKIMLYDENLSAYLKECKI